MQVYPNRLKAELNNGIKKAFYLVFGEEPQQKLTAIEQIRNAAKAEGFDERQSLSVDSQFSWNSLIEATQTMSLFASKQLIELELPTGKPGKEGAKILLELSENSNPDVILLLHGDKIGKDVTNTKWFKALDAQGCYVPCYALEGQQLYQWVNQQLSNNGFAADPTNSKIIADLCEGNMLAARQEIEKLALLYPDQSLTAEMIEKAITDQSRFNVFQLVDALLMGDAQRSIRVLNRLESEGIEPVVVLWALVREWQTLSSLVFMRQQGQRINWPAMRIWKNRQGLYQNAMQRHNEQSLKAMQPKLQHLDERLKSETVLRPYIELCHICMLFLAQPIAQLELA